MSVRSTSLTSSRNIDEAAEWVRSAWALKPGAPIVRYANGLVLLLRGKPGEARKVLDELAREAPGKPIVTAG